MKYLPSPVPAVGKDGKRWKLEKIGQLSFAGAFCGGVKVLSSDKNNITVNLRHT